MGPGHLPGLLWVLLGVMAMIWLFNSLVSGNGGNRVTYTRFLQLVDSGQVDTVVVRGQDVAARFRDSLSIVSAAGDTSRAMGATTFIPGSGTGELLDTLRARRVEIIGEPARNGSGWWIVLTSILPFIGLSLLLFWGMRGIASKGRGLLSLGQSGAKRYERSAELTTFDDVAGSKEAKEELREIITFLRDPEQFSRIGAHVPKGVLLIGPPGTGKTLLARAVAGEASVPFFSITGSDFMEMFVGIGASRVRDLFAQAKREAPAIIFIDEIDSIGRRRGTGLGGGHDEREQTLNQLLSELDGFEHTANVIVMAATNRPDILDPALLRPGRFDRRISVDLPTATERLAILELHSRGKPMASDVDLRSVANGTPGLSGAELDNLLNEAALTAGRAGRFEIGQRDIDTARDKILMGLRRSGLVLGDDELKIVAHHEAGHAVIAALLPKADPLHKVTIVPRGRAMGVTQQLPVRDRYIYERDYMLARITVLMGGRAAERLVFDTVTSGAQADLEEATHLARQMVTAWGMSDRLGPLSTGNGASEPVFLGRQLAYERPYSESTARLIDEEVGRILDDCSYRARSLLETHRVSLERAAGLLLAREELTGAEIRGLVDEPPVAASSDRIAGRPTAMTLSANAAGATNGRSNGLRTTELERITGRSGVNAGTDPAITRSQRPGPRRSSHENGRSIMPERLSGKRVAILAADGFQEDELLVPLKALDDAGADTVIVSLTKKPIRGWKHGNWSDPLDVDLSIRNAHAADFDALVLPGGVLSSDTLRQDGRAVKFVRHFFDDGKPVAAICHAPWLLVEADVVRNRSLTSYASLRTDILNAGGNWVDEQVVVDEALVTSRRPADLKAFSARMLQEIARGVHAGHAT